MSRFLLIEMGRTRIDSSMSLNGRLHWRARKRRTDALRRAVALMMLGFHAKVGVADARKHLEAGRLVVTLTRTGPVRMDDDNNTSALKAVRDEVARQLQVDDGDPRIQWVCKQAVGPWGLTIAVDPAAPEITAEMWRQAFREGEEAAEALRKQVAPMTRGPWGKP